MAAAAPYLLSGPARPRLPVLPGPGPSSPGEAAPAPLGACCRGRGRALAVGRQLPGWASGVTRPLCAVGAERGPHEPLGHLPVSQCLYIYTFLINKTKIARSTLILDRKPGVLA